MLRFFGAALVIQIITAMLTLAWFSTGRQDQTMLLILAGLTLLTTLLAGLWLHQMARHLRQQALAARDKDHAVKQERLKRKADRDKAKLQAASEKRLRRQARRLHLIANLKVGLAFGLAVAFGLFMLSTQFMTAGLLVLAAAGGGLGGFVLRGRLQNFRPAALPADQAKEELAPPATASSSGNESPATKEESSRES